MNGKYANGKSNGRLRLVAPIEHGSLQLLAGPEGYTPVIITVRPAMGMDVVDAAIEKIEFGYFAQEDEEPAAAETVSWIPERRVRSELGSMEADRHRDEGFLAEPYLRAAGLQSETPRKGDYLTPLTPRRRKATR